MGKVELTFEVDEDVADKAAKSGLDLAAIARAAAEAAVADPISAEARAKKWAQDNVEAIKAHRERIEQHGVFGEDLRTW